MTVGNTATSEITLSEDNLPLDRQKSSSAFRTIGEVAAELALPPHVLRFWESKFPQIKPHKRRGGHRYYRPADIDTLRTIKTLLYERGYTIKGAQKHLKDQKGTAQVMMFEDPALKAANTSETPTADLGRKDIHRLRKVLNGLEEVREMLVAGAR